MKAMKIAMMAVSLFAAIGTQAQLRINMSEDSPLRKLQMAEIATANLYVDSVDEKKLGLKGSPTQVERIFPPEKSSSREMLQGTEPELAAQLYGILRGRKFG